MEEETRRGLHSIERSNIKRSRPAKHLNHHSERRGERPSHLRRRKPPTRNTGRSFELNIFKLFLLVMVVLIFLVILLSTTFSNAEVVLRLKTETIVLDETFEATREPAQTGDLSYSIKGPFTSTKESEIFDFKKEPKYTKSEGTVTVYNTNLSGERLSLINRTRYLTEDGRTYRAIRAEKIPGGKKVNGKFVPGQKDIRVEADDVGQRFNINEASLRLTIPGLSKYKEFSDSYAITKTKIVGGYEGEKLIPNDGVLKKTRENLQIEIKSSLDLSLEDSLLNNSLQNNIVFEDNVFVEYELEEEVQNEESILIKEKGVLRAISFREPQLSSLINRTKNIFEKDPKFLSIQNLAIKIENLDAFDLVSDIDFSFNIKGETKLKWDLEEIIFLDEIIGKSEKEIENIISTKYPEIVEIKEIKIFPFWIKKLPKFKSKINIEKIY